MQGCRAFCNQVTQYIQKYPSIYSTILSLDYLREADKSNKNYLILKYKLLGHVFNLGGKFYLPDGSENDFEGFNETFVLPMLLDLFYQFASSVDGSSLISKEKLESILESLSKALWHENATDEKIEETCKLIHDPNYKYDIIVGSGWTWHSTQVIFKKVGEDIIVSYCNRGADCGSTPGIVQFKVINKDKITPEFLKKLTRRLQVTGSEYIKLNEITKILCNNEEPKAVMHRYIRMKEQKVGNCVYYSLKAVFRVLFEDENSKGPSLFDDSAGDDFDRGLHTYKKFSQFIAESVLQDILLDVKHIDLKTISQPENRKYLKTLFVIDRTLNEQLSSKTKKNNYKVGKNLLNSSIAILAIATQKRELLDDFFSLF